MNAPALLRLSGHGALEASALAAVKLNAAMPTANVALIDSRRRALVFSLERLQQAGVTSVWLTDWISALSDERLWMVEFCAGVPGLLRKLGELLNIDEAWVAAPAGPSRPASPPPPSGRGDEEAEEQAAARGTRDTAPPASGYCEMVEMSCCGADTDPPEPGSMEWMDEQPMVRS
jgi:hypothetical protein